MLKSLDRIKELTSTSGTGTLTLTGAETGFQAFSVLGNGTKCYYTITDVNGTDFEVGEGTYNSNTLTRDTIFESSNSGNAISLSATGSTVFVTYPAEKSSYRDIGVNRDYTASGSITAGKPLILNADNTVTQVAESTTGAVTEAYSAETALNDPSEKVVVVSDGNGTFLMVYQGSSLYTTIQAGTMSGTTMTWGTAQVFQSTDTNGTAAWWDSYRSCFVVCARSTAGSTYIRVKTITVSGQAITINDTAQTQVFGGSYDQSTMRGGYDSTAQVGFFVNTRGNSPTKTSIVVVSVDSSKYVSFGTEVQDNDRIYNPSQFVHDANGNGNVAVIGARYNSSTSTSVGELQAYVITISGTTPTIKTPVNIATYTYKYGYSVYDASANKTVCIYGDGSKVYYNVCSMSSGVITSGTETEIATGNITEATQEFAYAGCYDPFTEQIGITYHDSSNYYYLRSGKVSGTSITWSSALQVDPSTANKHVNVVNANSSNSNTLVLYWVNFDSAFNTWTIGKTGVTASNLTANNYFGIASSTASDTEAVGVNRAGSINIDQTGLTAGKDYYAKGDGTIVERTTTVGSTTTVNASQFVGTARSSTDLELAEPPTELVGTANGSITKGNAIVLRSDGDFTKVVSSGGAQSELISSTSNLPSPYMSGSGNGNITSDGNGTIFYAYFNSSNYPHAVAGTADSSTGLITWGTPLVISSVAFNSDSIGAVYYPTYNSDAGGFGVMAQRNSLSRTTFFGIKYSGTTLTYGDDNSFGTQSNSADFHSLAYDSVNDAIFGVTGKPYSMLSRQYQSSAGTYINQSYAQAIFGSYDDKLINGNLIWDNTNERGTIGYIDFDNNYYPTVLAFTSTTSAPTFGTPVVLESTNSNGGECNVVEGEADGKGTIAVWISGNNVDLKTAVLSYSGTTITVGSTVVADTGTAVHGNRFTAYIPFTKNYIITYQNNSNSDLKIVVGDNSSDTLTWQTPVTVNSDVDWYSMYITNTGVTSANAIVGYTNGSPNVVGVTYAPAYDNFTTNLTSGNFIGFAQQTVADNEDVKVKTVSQVDENQSSLTAGTQYFVNNSTGALQTTADTISVVGGTALSSTKILIKS